MRYWTAKMGLLLSVLVFVPLTAQVQTKLQKPAVPASAVSGSGCVEAGVEAGCIVLSDSKSKTLYNLYFGKGKKPAIGAAIHFSGERHDGPTACMQGEPVDVKKWNLIKMKCAAKGN